MDDKTPLQRVFDVISPSELARAIGRSQSTIWEWQQKGWASPDACADIAAAVDHAVTEEELMRSAAELKKAARIAAAEKRRNRSTSQEAA